MSSSNCRRMVSLCLSDACSSRASRLPRRVTSRFSRVTSLRSSPRSARSDSIVAFWFSACSRVARSRRLALSAGEVGLCLVGSMLASERSFSRRVTSACKESASFAVRRTSCVSSTAAFSLLRLLSSCHFREPVRARGLHLCPAQLLTARFGRVRTRPFPLRAGMLPLAFRTPVSRRARRCCLGRRPNPVLALNQRQA